MVRPIYIYQDEGVSQVGVDSLLKAIPVHLNRPAQCIEHKAIQQGQLHNALALIIPGGADLPYCKRLNGEGNRQIQHFISHGGLYIGICAGAYYACEHIIFQGAQYGLKATRELALLKGTARGSLAELTNNHFYDETVYSKALISLTFPKENQTIFPFYYHGGPAFELAPSSNANIIAHYQNGKAAVVTGKYGKGRYLLSGVHFELQAESYAQWVHHHAPINEKTQEQALCSAFDRHYGNKIWQEIQQLLNLISPM